MIYRKPTDFPATPYVVREHVLENGEVNPTNNFKRANTLWAARRHIPIGAVQMPRHEKDEPQIVEWWV